MTSSNRTDNNRRNVLVVDDEPKNRQLMREILKGRYKLSFATDGAEAIEAAYKVKPDLILLDIMMPAMDGYETCRRLKADALTASIPVIFVTARGEVEDESLGFTVGGVDYIIKPVSAPIVLARVATHLALYNQQRACEEIIAQRTLELEKSQRAAVFMLGEAGHHNDTDTGIHIWRMAAYSEAIARAAGWPVEKSAMLALAATMHDTGKIGISDVILTKPGKLDAQEWAIMKAHTTIGHSILSKSDTPLFRMAAEVALYHHEKWDGTGYPEGLKELETPQIARIVAIADVFDALTMKRPYKEAWPIDRAFEEIRKSAGSHLDPFLVECFFAIEEDIRRVKEAWDQKEKDQ